MLAQHLANAFRCEMADVCQRLNRDRCGGKWDDLHRTAPVRSFPANAWDLHDMHGDVWEWVDDCRHESDEDTPEDGRAWLEENGGDRTARVLRGGPGATIRTARGAPAAAGTTVRPGRPHRFSCGVFVPRHRSLITEGRLKCLRETASGLTMPTTRPASARAGAADAGAGAACVGLRADKCGHLAR
jgi:hypothetical protein